MEFLNWCKMKLIQGDCLKIMPDIEDGLVDMIMADPPYGTTACKWDSIIPLEPMWEQLKRVIKPNGAIVMTASQPFTTTLISSNMKMFKYCWVWEKNRGSNFGCVRFQPMKEHEDVAVFGAGRITYNPTMEKRKGSGSDRIQYKIVARTKTENYADSLHKEIELKCSEMRYPSSIQKFNTATGKEKVKHPTQKPVALMEYLIKTYTNENETVLDFTMGSGTTGVACKNLNRNFIGIELDTEYFKIAEKRIKEVGDES